VKRTSRSKSERIKIKMLRSSNAGKRSIKSMACRARRSGGWENTLALAKVYSCFSRARGLLSVYLFF
jgi:hypothetical protein